MNQQNFQKLHELVRHFRLTWYGGIYCLREAKKADFTCDIHVEILGTTVKPEFSGLSGLSHR